MYLRQKTNLGGVEYQALSCCNVEGGPAPALYQLQIWWPRPPKLYAGFLHPISNTPWNTKKPQTHHHAQWTISVINKRFRNHQKNPYSQNTGTGSTLEMQRTGSISECRKQDPHHEQIQQSLEVQKSLRNTYCQKIGTMICITNAERNRLYMRIWRTGSTSEMQRTAKKQKFNSCRFNICSPSQDPWSEHQLAFVH
jgi:hypothetical protein